MGEWIHREIPGMRCRGCKDRTPTCHDTCEDFIKARDKLRESKMALSGEKKFDYECRKIIKRINKGAKKKRK